MPRPPIPVHAFFEQPVLKGEVGHNFLQRGRLTTQILYLAGGCRTRRIARQAAIPSRRHNSEMFSSSRSPSSTMRIFSSAEYCRRV
ncbi:hypothetical protein ACVJGD_005560 [Bradyrhizobium sp. USDA 10063]